jgi:hypothetical protein
VLAYSAARDRRHFRGEDDLGDPTGTRASLPAKITSSMPFAARPGACSPMAQRMASTTFDLPQPFGPTIAVIPGWKAKAVLSTKLLKPLIWSDLIRNRSPRAACPQRGSIAASRRR